MTLASVFGSITIAFGFAVVGLLINYILMNLPFYDRLSHLNFIRSDKANKYLGVLYFRQMLITSFWRHFNPKIKITGRATHSQLLNLRREMTYAEISHLVAFLCVLAVAVFAYRYKPHNMAVVPLLISNVLFHFYPALVQQYNKRRLDVLLTRIKNNTRT